MNSQDTEKNKLVCFIDLLGTKNSSRVSVRQYNEAIQIFHKQLLEKKKNLTSGYRISGFSDSAFLELNIDKESFKFLIDLRETLFAKEYYFKCSVILGELQMISGLKDDENYMSVRFGAECVNTYLLHESFKGIGYIFEEKIIEYMQGTEFLDLVKNLFVKSFYFLSDNMSDPIGYSDLKYNERFVGEKEFLIKFNEGEVVEPKVNHLAYMNFNSLLKSLIIARTKSKKYVKYYMPVIVSLINSSDFSEIEYNRAKNVWICAPLVFFKIFLDKVFEKRFLDIAGSEYVYYALINKIYDSVIDEYGFVIEDRIDVVEALAKKIVKKKKIKELISEIPEFVFKEKFRADFIGRMANIEMTEI